MSHDILMHRVCVECKQSDQTDNDSLVSARDFVKTLFCCLFAITCQKRGSRVRDHLNAVSMGVVDGSV